MFNKARIELTAWYLLIIMSISLTFSAIIYQVLTKEVERFERMQMYRIEQRWQLRLHQIPLTAPELLAETKGRILFALFIINGAIFLVAGGLGYILAGRTLEPIQEMVDEQNRFIGDASHEFRTPLTSLKSAFEVYLRNPHPKKEESKTLVEESIAEVDRLQSLSESLLQLAQYEKPNNHSQFEVLSLSEVLKESIRKIEPIAQKKGVVIQKKIKDVEVKGDKYGLIDLFVILLENAVKYSFQKSKVIVTNQLTNNFVSVSIKDFGIGIDEKDVSRIFDRFYRSDTARTKLGKGGYGLGLSIAKKIVDLHKGTIRVESKSKKGTTVTVRLRIS